MGVSIDGLGNCGLRCIGRLSKGWIKHKQGAKPTKEDFCGLGASRANDVYTNPLLLAEEATQQIRPHIQHIIDDAAIAIPIEQAN